MEKNRSFLTEFLDQEIYVIKEDQKGYIERQSDITSQSQVEEQEIEYSGSNSKGVIIIVDDNISEDEEALLNNILSSIKLTRDEIALIQNTSDFTKLVEHLSKINSTKLISFGVNSGKSVLLDIQTKYAPTTVQGRTVIMADSLSELNQNKELKRMLWKSLQEAF